MLYLTGRRFVADECRRTIQSISTMYCSSIIFQEPEVLLQVFDSTFTPMGIEGLITLVLHGAIASMKYCCRGSGVVRCEKQLKKHGSINTPHTITCEDRLSSWSREITAMVFGAASNVWCRSTHGAVVYSRRRARGRWFVIGIDFFEYFPYIACSALLLTAGIRVT